MLSKFLKTNIFLLLIFSKTFQIDSFSYTLEDNYTQFNHKIKIQTNETIEQNIILQSLNFPLNKFKVFNLSYAGIVTDLSPQIQTLDVEFLDNNCTSPILCVSIDKHPIINFVQNSVTISCDMFGRKRYFKSQFTFQ